MRLGDGRMKSGRSGRVAPGARIKTSTPSSVASWVGAFWAAVVGATAVAGCGESGEETPLAISIATRSQALLAGVETVRIRLHPGPRLPTCQAVFASGPDYVAVYGATIPIGADDDSAEGTIFEVVSGNYRLDGWGFDSSDEPTLYGCSPNPVVIETGRLARADLELQSL